MSKPIKVLEMIAALNFGGSQAMIINLCKAMNKNNVHCDFIVDHPEYMGMAPVVEELGSKIYVLPSFKGTNIKEIQNAWEKFFLEHGEYQILHSHSRSYASLYLPIAKRHGLKTIIHSHNTSNGKGISSIAKMILQYPLRYQSDYYFGCSKEAGEWLFGKKVVSSNNFYVLNNAIDTDKFAFNKTIRNEYRKQFGLQDEKVFIQVGRLDVQKNHSFMLNAFKKYTEINPNSKLFIIGNGVLKEEILSQIGDLKLNDNVIMLEGRNDVNNLLQMADCFVMPSLFEGLSVAGIEAQASGIKCLMSDRVDSNVNVTGLCSFIPLDENAWVKEMCYNEYERVNTKSIIMESGFDIKETAKWLEKFYCEIVGK